MTLKIVTQQGGAFGGKHFHRIQKFSLGRAVLLILISLVLALQPIAADTMTAAAQNGSGERVYLPSVVSGRTSTVPKPSTPLLHVPFIDVADIHGTRYSSMTIFWFGNLSPSENYYHVRLANNRDRLTVEVSGIDRRLWYDQQSPSHAEVSQWDGASVYLQVPGQGGQSSRLLRFDAQLSHWQDRALFQAVYERTSGGWTKVNRTFGTDSAWRGNGLNDTNNDKGWTMVFEIPFSSLGLAGRPTELSEWRMAVRGYDQDSGPGGTNRTTSWPEGFSESNPNTYGVIAFGYPPLASPGRAPAGSVAIKNAPGTPVPDGTVGGWTTCGSGIDHWTEWGEMVYDSGEPSEKVAIQNQKDISEYPCFARYYVRFPLNPIPAGKVITSAKLVMHHFGNASPSEAYASYIQVFRVGNNWTEQTLSWNNSPQVIENYPGVWVEPLRSYPGIPGIKYEWDVTQALLDARNSANPNELSLSLQSADAAMHSGKYFWASETASWNSTTPPTLVVEWANP